MEVYETEEQQVEAVKKWWKENGVSLIVGVVMGLSAIAGWKYYQGEQSNHSISASNMYLSMINQYSALGEKAEVDAMAEQLASQYADTPYAALATLVMAKIHYESGNVDAAISQLAWASKNANDIETQQIAQTRLIRVYISEDKYDEADKLLNMSHPSAFDANYEELKGDYLVAKNQPADARIAYDRAIVLYGDKTSGLLQMKRQNLGD